MTIVHITQYFHPLKGYQENQFAKYHKKLFDKVFIIASSDTRLWNSILYEDLLEMDLEYTKQTGVSVIRLKTFPIVISDRVFISGLAWELDRISPDYIYVHSLSSIMTIVSCNWINQTKRLRSVKAIVDDHMVYIASKNPLSSLFYKSLSRLFLEKFLMAFDKWIAVSEETKNFLIDKFGKSLIERIEIIPLGVDLNVFKKELRRRTEVRVHNKIDEKTSLIVYTGKRDKIKDPFILLKVLKQLLEMGFDYKLLLVGENVNSYDGIIYRYIDENTVLQERVIIKPPVVNNELPSIYSAADLAVWPNQSSMSMLEAMACRCPVVASDINVNSERLGNGRGVLFKIGDENSLLKAILKTEVDKKKITEAAYNWIVDYDWDQLAQLSVKFNN